MGLLDEAIREHLELKRRRGADPAEVAREQHEALDPVTDGASSAGVDVATEERPLEHEPALEHGELSTAAALESVDPLSEVAEDPLPAPVPEGNADAPASGHHALLEETAELDMNTVFNESPAREHPGFEPGVPGDEH